jgi:AraC-like DNA-binding protein
LEPHGVYAATNAADAALYGRDLLGPHRVHVDPADARRFAASYHAVLVRDITLGYLDYAVEVVVDVQELPPDPLVIVPATGASVVTIDGEELATSPVQGVVTRPGQPLKIRCDGDTAHLIVRLDRDSLRRHISRILGRPVDALPTFEPTLDLAAPTASRWNAAIQMLHAELFEPESLLNQGIGIGPIEEFVMSSLLYSQRSDISDELASPRRAERSSVTEARRFIELRLGEPITVADIADAAGTNLRTLQQHFSQDLAMSPTEYLRQARLDRARDDLADAVPGSGVTVADVAARWGINHLGRFSAAYRKRFGESPSETLRG